MGYSEAGGETIHEKNQKQKNSWHCPFKLYYYVQNVFTRCYIIFFSPSLLFRHKPASLQSYSHPENPKQKSKSWQLFWT
jgi:hypothetical protein